MIKLILLTLISLILTSCENFTLDFKIADPYNDPNVNYFDFDHDLNLTLDDDFTILFIADNHQGKVKKGTIIKNKEFKELLDSKSIDYDLVINLGDVTDNSTEEQYKQYKKWCDDTFGDKKVINVLGNHDIRRGGIERFLSHVSSHPKSTYFRFTISDIQFYLLDSAFRSLGKSQIKYLKESLEKNKDEKKIILSHTPLYGDLTNFYASFADEKERNYLISLFSKTNCRLYIAGHKHTPQTSFSYTHSFSEINVGALHGERIRSSMPTFSVLSYDKATILGVDMRQRG